MSGSLPLALYRAATRLGEPVGPLLLQWRRRRGKEDDARWRERLGEPARPRPSGALAWLHGASVGEGVALVPLVAALVEQGLSVLVTTGTVTSSRVLAERLPAGAVHQFVPLDLPDALARFFDHWRPDLLCIAESELWPNLLAEARRRRVPAVLVNARMSDRSFRRWRRLASTIEDLLGGFSVVLAQSDADAGRFQTLGAEQVTTTGNIKFDVPALAADPARLRAVQAAIGDRPVWLAASTHADEDALCCDTHVTLRRVKAGLLTMIVPRQADRGARIVALAADRGLRVAVRSRGEEPGPETDIYLADTMGELGVFFRLAPVVFMGKSLVAGGGGQNPIEPAKLGCAVLHGPSVANFRDIYGAFDRTGGCRLVRSADELAAVLKTLLDDPGQVAAMAEAAARVVAANEGSTVRTVEAMRHVIEAARHRPAA